MGVNIPEWRGSLNSLSATNNWVQLRSATVGTITVQADPNGQFLVVGMPTGTYTLWTGPNQTGPWTQQDSNYVVSAPPQSSIVDAGFFASNPPPNMVIGTGGATYDKGGMVFHPLAYGTVDTTGAVDSSAVYAQAVAAAVAAGGGSVFVLEGTSLWGASAINLSATGVGLIGTGYGSAIKVASGGNDIVTVSAAGCTVEKLRLIPSGTFSGTGIRFTAVDGVADRVWVDGSAATANYGNAILFITNPCDRGSVRFCKILQANGATNYGNGGVEIRDSADVEVVGCYINGGRSYPIDARSATGLSTGTRVIGNLLVGGATHGIVLWNGRARVIGNEIRNSGGYAIFLTGDPASGFVNHGSTVFGNTILSPTSGGIDCEYDVHEFAIVGNTVNGGIQGIATIHLITDGVIDGNTVLGSTDAAYGGITMHVFAAATSSSRITITNNVVRNCTAKGIYMEDGANSIVRGNTCSGNASGFTQNGTYATGLLVEHNDFRGNTVPFSGALEATSVFRFNAGLNPRGSGSAPAFPATTVVYTNTTAGDVLAYITNGTSSCSCVVSGITGNVTIVIPASGFASILIPAGQTFTPTYAAGAPAWVHYIQ